jgi:hypothetical protein
MVADETPGLSPNYEHQTSPFHYAQITHSSPKGSERIVGSLASTSEVTRSMLPLNHLKQNIIAPSVVLQGQMQMQSPQGRGGRQQTSS